MQQGGSQYGVSPEMTPFSGTSTSRTHMLGLSSSDHLQQQQQQQQKSGDAAMAVAEAASPISSRPPAVARSAGNFDELVPVSSGGFPDEEALAGEESERGVTGGNRWPRQETLALLKIRSEMDTAFRDATLKGPLWEEVSRKLADLGYIRSAKKCKEKFENVHKYYKRTKEGRAGRQDGKSYRFFTQLEALHSGSGSTTTIPALPTTSNTITTTNPPTVVAVSMGMGMVGSSAGRIQPPVSATPIATTTTTTTQIGVSRIVPPPDLSGGIATGVSGFATAAGPTVTAGISFSSNTSSSSSDSDDDDLEGGPSNTNSRKRKRGSSGGSSSRKMMIFFEGLIKQVMEKQEAMQQRFLETIEKREQDRMIREEAWKRQEMARLSREHEIMVQERAISASRDAAVINFLQKITGQTIQLPQPLSIPAAPPPQSTPTPPPQAPPPQHHHHHQQQQQQHQHQPHQHHPSQSTEVIRHQPASTEIVIAVPEQQHPPAEMGSGSFDPTSSRWPKAEVHALIKLRSGLELRYQEAGPKGPLWEEISGGMQRMGYNRSAKRCKEKWENINKYFKKVKESNKKRPEDAKTCPYFHQLDALYRKKVLGSSSSSGGTGGGGSGSFGNQTKQEPQQQQSTMVIDPNPATNLQAITGPPPPAPAAPPQTSEAENKNNNKNGGGNAEVQSSNEGFPPSFFEEGNSGGGGGGTKKPEDIVKVLMEQQQQQHHHQQQSVMDDYDKLEEADSDNLDQEEDEDEDEDDMGEDTEEESKMAYKIQFQRQNVSSSNGGGNAANSFSAMVK